MKIPLLSVGSIVLGLIFSASAASASDDSLITAVFANVSNGYKRAKLPDGTFKPETYALGNGGYTPGLGEDPSIDAIPFSTIALVAGKYLARQNYVLAEDAKSADLLLVISWGKTIPFNDAVIRNGQSGMFSAMNQVKIAGGAAALQAAQSNSGGSGGRSVDGIQSGADAVAGAARDAMEGQLFEMQMFNSMREKANESNARLLGYSGEINARNNATRFAGAGTTFSDLIEDIESERYYIIVAAYDFKAAMQKERKLLWASRISVQAQGNRFDEAMATMISTASRQFGQETGRLIRRYQTGYKVEYGELKVMGIGPEAATQEKAAEKK